MTNKPKMKVNDEHREIAEKLVYPMDLHDKGEINSAESSIAKALAQRDQVMIDKCAEVAENYLVTNKQYAGISKAIRALGDTDD